MPRRLEQSPAIRHPLIRPDQHDVGFLVGNPSVSTSDIIGPIWRLAIIGAMPGPA